MPPLKPHPHVPNKTNDSCAECGLFLSHPIHLSHIGRNKLSEEEARDKVFNDYLDNTTRSVRKARLFYKTTIAQLEAQCEALADNCIKHGSEIHQLEERLEAAIDNKTCLIDTKGGSRIRVVGQDLWDNNEELEAKLLAHTENEGDECPLCALEAEKDAYRTGLAMFMHRYLHETDTHIWETCAQNAWLERADTFIQQNNLLT
jgi:septal ring factor EnvC (AmiA/AmiB activator)